MKGLNLDPGYGAYKFEHNGVVGEIPSHVVRPRGREADLSLLGMDKAAKVMNINNSFGSFLVGLGATDHPGAIEDSTDFERLSDASPEVRALLYAAFTQAAITGSVSVNVALPIGLVTMANAKQRVADMRGWLTGEHHWQVGRDKRVLTVANVNALSQAQALYFDVMLDERGEQVGDVEDFVVTVSVGSNTVEVLGFEEGKPQMRLAGGPKSGVRYLFEMVNSDRYRGTRAIQAIDAAYRRGKIAGDVLSSALSNWHSKIRTDVRNILGDDIERQPKVILAGGGAPLALPVVKSIFGADNIIVPDKPVFSVVRGLAKWQAAQERK